MHDLGAFSLFPYAVYTTLGFSRFEDAVVTQVLTFTERKRWTSAAEILNEARKRRQHVPLLISDGTRDTSRILGWGILEWIELVRPKARGGTLVRATKVRRLKGRRTQDLLLRGTGHPIAPVFIRPYALVHTPAFLPTGRTVQAPFRDAPTALTLFTFGYKGYGSATDRLVHTVDAVEKTRGFHAPLWVDVRVSRSVRAIGFREKAFQVTLGPDRYLWMPDLGNDSVVHGGDRVQIRRPAAVADLLRLALDNPDRRVIFFCSCAGDSGGCHRHVVARLLLKHACSVGTEVRCVEWPGGEPATLAFDVPSASNLQRETVEVRGALSDAEAAAVPWGSPGIVRAGTRLAEHVLLGPGLFGKMGTVLRVAKHLGSNAPSDPMSVALRWRKRHNADVKS